MVSRTFIKQIYKTFNDFFFVMFFLDVEFFNQNIRKNDIIVILYFN